MDTEINSDFVEEYDEQKINIRKNLLNFEHRWKIRDWIDINKLDWWGLSNNPKALYLLESNPDRINFKELSKNRNDYAMEILSKHPDKIYYEYLSSNPNAISILKNNMDKIDFRNLSMNENALDLIMENQDKINWYLFCTNENENIIHFLNNNPDKINFDALLTNKNAWNIILENESKINFTGLARNTNTLAVKYIEDKLTEHYENVKNMYVFKLCLSSNPSAIYLLEKYPELIDWHSLSSNTEAMEILEKNQDNIFYSLFSSNPSIFELDYEFFFKRMNIIRKELLEKTWHPSRIMNWCLSIDEII